MKILRKLSLIASLLLGMDVGKWIYGALLIVTHPEYWTIVGVDTYAPMMLIVESPLILTVELVFIAIAMTIIIIALAKGD